MYRKETEEQQRRVDRYIADGADEWDIKTQVRRSAVVCGRAALTRTCAAKAASRSTEDGPGLGDATRRCGRRAPGRGGASSPLHVRPC